MRKRKAAAAKSRLLVEEAVVVDGEPEPTPKRVRRRKRKWMTLDIGGARWPVWLVDPATLKKCADDAEVEGITNYTASEILIDDTVEGSRRAVVLVHEMMHACFSAPGMGAVLPHLFGCAEDKMPEVEEQVVCLLAPTLTGALGHMLRLPRVPR